MKKIEQVLQDKVVDIICDVCGRSCTDLNSTCKNAEYARLFAEWGFDSNKDTERHECHMCEECYDKVVKFIESLGGRVNVTNYMWS